MQRLCERELKLATAESCTGGLAAALLTDIEGCSHAFDRALVAYTDIAKTELLGVSPALLRAHGAVSRPVALAMADGALARSGADIAVAVTGFAGPTPDAGEEGHVHFALARTGERTRHTERAFGPLGRDRIREACLTTMLGLLEDALT
jgi:nicotinamide-nucleotide amidase